MARFHSSYPKTCGFGGRPGCGRDGDNRNENHDPPDNCVFHTEIVRGGRRKGYRSAFRALTADAMGMVHNGGEIMGGAR